MGERFELTEEQLADLRSKIVSAAVIRGGDRRLYIEFSFNGEVTAGGITVEGRGTRRIAANLCKTIDEEGESLSDSK